MTAGDAEDRPRLVIIVGSTASGKEQLALACAEQLNGEIVSVDSMKVYRGLDIATAKAGPDDRKRIPHHCLDLVEPTQGFSAADFVTAADAAIASIHSRGKMAVLSGGTALYYRALLDGLFEGPGADPAIRAEIETLADRHGTGHLHHMVQEQDPAAAAKIHPSDRRRLVRALEIIRLTGDTISSRQRQWHNFHAADNSGPASLFTSPRYPFSMFRIVRERGDIHRRIRRRVARMDETGLYEETLMVFQRRAEMTRTPLQAVGYKEFFPHFEGLETWPEALEKLCLATNRLVRSQDTWFRKFPANEIQAEDTADVQSLADQVIATLGG